MVYREKKYFCWHVDENILWNFPCTANTSLPDTSLCLFWLIIISCYFFLCFGKGNCPPKLNMSKSACQIEIWKTDWPLVNWLGSQGKRNIWDFLCKSCRIFDSTGNHKPNNAFHEWKLPKKKTKATTKKRKLLIIMIEVLQRSSNYKSRKHTVLERQIIN